MAAALAAAFVLAVPLDLAPWLRGPAPYPPEWQWEYRAPLAGLPPLALALALLVPLLAAASGPPVLRRRERPAARGLELAAVVLGFALPLALLAREPAGALRTLLARTASFSTTSYHTAALSDEARDPLAFVRRHAELLPGLAGTAKHAATHPVGPVLYFRAAIAACERSPALTERAAPARRPCRSASSRRRSRARPAPARCSAPSASASLAAATAWPLARLGRALGLTPLAASRAALVWTLLPAPALIAPALRRGDRPAGRRLRPAAPGRAARRRATAAAGNGSPEPAAACALLLSYGAAAFLAIAALAAVAAGVAAPSGARSEPHGRSLRRGGVALAASAPGSARAGVRPARPRRRPPGRGAADGARHPPRGVHGPAKLRALAAVRPDRLRSARGRRGRGARRRRRRLRAAVDVARSLSLSPLRAFGLVFVAGAGALVVSGATRGEVGRLWIPLMPLLLLAALPSIDTEDPRPATLLAALTALCTLAVAAAWRV